MPIPVKLLAPLSVIGFFCTKVTIEVLLIVLFRPSLFESDKESELLKIAGVSLSSLGVVVAICLRV